MTLQCEPEWHQWQQDTLVLSLHLHPRARRTGFAGVHNGRQRVDLTAPPVDGKANAALVTFLAKQFGVPRGRVAVIRGQTSRMKTVSIDRPTRLPEELDIPPAPDSR